MDSMFKIREDLDQMEKFLQDLRRFEKVDCDNDANDRIIEDGKGKGE